MMLSCIDIITDWLIEWLTEINTQLLLWESGYFMTCKLFCYISTIQWRMHFLTGRGASTHRTHWIHWHKLETESKVIGWENQSELLITFAVTYLHDIVTTNYYIIIMSTRETTFHTIIRQNACNRQIHVLR